jgi:hypothetical protein
MEIKELLLLPKSSYENKAFMRGWFSNWNQATDDGDWARMEADLRLDIRWHEYSCEVRSPCGCIWRFEYFQDHNGDKQAARRMASLRVAVAIYDSMG